MIEIDFPEKLSRFQFPTNEAACNDKRGEKRNSDSSSISQASIMRIEKKRKKRKKNEFIVWKFLGGKQIIKYINFLIYVYIN